MTVRNVTRDDVDTLKSLSKQCVPLGQHTSFTYWMLCQYFSNLCYILEDEDRNPIGFVSAIRSSSVEGAVYLWQIGIVEQHRGKGLSKILIDAIVGSIHDDEYIQFSIDDTNKESLGAFSSYAKANGLSMDAVDQVDFTDPFTQVKENETIYQYRSI